MKNSPLPVEKSHNQEEARRLEQCPRPFDAEAASFWTMERFFLPSGDGSSWWKENDPVLDQQDRIEKDKIA